MERERTFDLVVDGLLGDVRGLQAEVSQLREAMSTRAVIEQAKGIMMMRHGTDADTAFAMLSRRSQAANVKLRVVAQELVDEVGHRIVRQRRPDGEPAGDL